LTSPSHSPTISTAPATGSVLNGTNAVSAITEGMVSHTVQSSITAFEQKRKIAYDAFDARMAKLETQVDDISSQVTQMTTQISKAVIATLTADGGVIKRQEAKMDKMETIIVKMAASIQNLLEQGHARDRSIIVHSPPRPPRERETSTGDTASDGYPSPDRQKQKLNSGVPTEDGDGTRGE
jgi:outer membrane murein-binding lipoprotein Lpp